MTPERRAIWALRILGSLALLATGLTLGWFSAEILGEDRAHGSEPLLVVWGAYVLTVWIFARVSWRALR